MARQTVIIIEKEGELHAFGGLKRASEIFREINLGYLYKKRLTEGEKFEYKGLIIHKLAFY